MRSFLSSNLVEMLTWKCSFIVTGSPPHQNTLHPLAMLSSLGGFMQVKDAG